MHQFRVKKQAKSQCSPSSREINSLAKLKPGINPRFFSQKIEQKLPEKKMPSTAAKATKRSAKSCHVKSIARPILLFLYARDSINGMEKIIFFCRTLNIGIDQQGICFRMDILDHDLKSIKTTCFRILNFTHKIDGQDFH